MQQTAKEQAAFLLWMALGMGFTLFVLYALFPDQHNTALALQYRNQINEGTEEEAMDAVRLLGELKDQNVPALVEALASPRPRVSQAAAIELRKEVNSWENMSPRRTAAKFQVLVDSLAKELPNFHRNEHAIASDLAMRVVMWKGLDNDPSKPQILETCDRILLAARNAGVPAYANAGNSFGSRGGATANNPYASASSNPYATTTNNPYDDSRVASSNDSRGQGWGGTSSFGQSNSFQPSATLGGSNSGTTSTARTTPSSHPGASGFASHTASNPYTATNSAKSESAFGRDSYTPANDPSSDIMHRSQLPGGNLPTSTSIEPNRNSGFSIPSASISGGRSDTGNPFPTGSGSASSGTPFNLGSSTATPSSPSFNTGSSSTKANPWGTSPVSNSTSSGTSSGLNSSTSGSGSATGGSFNNSLGPWNGGSSTSTGSTPSNATPSSSGGFNSSAFGTSSGLTPVQSKSAPTTSGGSFSGGGFSGGGSAVSLSPAGGSSISDKAGDAISSMQNAATSVVSNAKSQWGQLSSSSPSLDPSKLLQDPNPASREQLAKTITTVPGVDAKPYLLTLSRDQDANVRLAAVGIMATSSDPDLTKRAMELSSDPDPRIQAIAQRLKGQK